MKKILLLLCISFGLSGLFVLLWNNIGVLEEQEPISRYISQLHDVPMGEPKEYFYQYHKEFESTALYVYQLDISNWHMEYILGYFETTKKFQSKEEILGECKENLHFKQKEELGAMEDLLTDWDIEDCVWVQTKGEATPSKQLVLLYHPEREECILISSHTPR